MQNISLATSVTSNGTQSAVAVDIANGVAKANRTYQATVSGTGSLTATVKFYGSQNNTNFPSIPFGTITLSGSSMVTDGFASVAAWPYVKCDISNITGTSASVDAGVVL